MNADLVLLDGRLVPMANAVPGATSVAIVGDRIAEVGPGPLVSQWIGPRTRVMELGGRSVVPGLIDSHCHLLWTGLRHVRPSLEGVASIAQLQAVLREEARRRDAGDWIVFAPAWRPSQLAEGRYPTRWELDEVAPAHRVLLPNFHAAVANSRALEAAGVDRSVMDPVGGEIVRDGSGEPTGLLQEQPAIWLLERHVPAADAAGLGPAVTTDMRTVHEAGVTSIIEPALSLDELAAYEHLEAEGRLPVRVAAMLRIDEDPATGAVLDLLGRWDVRPGGTNWLKRHGVKVFVDGAFFQGKAQLQAPYANAAHDRRFQLHRAPDLLAMMEAAVDQGWVFGTHSSGDAAVGTVLDVFGDVRSRRPDARLQTMHAHLVDPADLDRLSADGIVVVPQPAAIPARGAMVEELLGHERAARLWPFASLLARGAVLAGSSDAPIYPVDPLAGIRAAATRQVDGTDRIHAPGERLDVEAALAMFTVGGARAMGEEATRGTIEVGKLADLAVLSANLLSADRRVLDDIAVDATIIGGSVVYDSRS